MNNRDLAILFFRDWIDDYRSGMGFAPVLTLNVAEEAYAALLAFEEKDSRQSDEVSQNVK